jgi:hypothetical protein
MYLRGGLPWYVTDDPLDPAFYERRPWRLIR